MIYRFWLEHADAAGVALIALGLAALGWYRQRRHYRARISVVEALRDADHADADLRAEFLRGIIADLTGSGFRRTAGEAAALTVQLPRTRLDDSYVGRTAEIPLNAGLPSWTSGGAV